MERIVQLGESGLISEPSLVRCLVGMVALDGRVRVRAFPREENVPDDQVQDIVEVMFETGDLTSDEPDEVVFLFRRVMTNEEISSSVARGDMIEVFKDDLLQVIHVIDEDTLEEVV